MADMNNQPIGIFDSGLGGLTVARAIAERLPHESLVYFGDTQRCPYGPRPLGEVQLFVQQICSWLTSCDVKLIVIACNTATAAGLAMAQQVFDIPIVGVVEPGARAAVRATRNRRIGVIATEGTVESGVYQEAICALDAGMTVYANATPRFVELVEEGLRRDGDLEQVEEDLCEASLHPTFVQTAHDYLDPITDAGIDTLVLGCTHFPILESAIEQAVGDGISLINSADETAKDVAEILSYRGHLSDGEQTPQHRFITTGEDLEEFERLGTQIFGAPLENLERIELAS